MSTIQSLLESANPWKSLQSDAAKLSSKWNKTGLLEGLTNVEANNMSLLLENQAKQLVMEQSDTGGGSSAGSFSVGQSENWAGIALPLVRKVFAQISAKEFVSVQPMSMPSGLVFFLDFQYGTNKNPFTVGGSLYGNRNATGEFPFATPAPAGGLYGTGRFTYSTNQFSASSTILSAAINSASYSDVNFDQNYSASVANGTIQKIVITSATTTLPAFDPDAVRGFLVVSGAIASADNFQQFNSYNYTANTVTLFVSASFAELAPTGSYTVDYNKATQMSNYNVGDFEDSSSFSTPNAESNSTIVIPEINVKMQSQAITAKTKKLKAVWTPEFSQDLAAYQNIDAEAEVTNIMSEYISMEIDLEILDMLI
jgi:hypothetical protein